MMLNSSTRQIFRCTTALSLTLPRPVLRIAQTRSAVVVWNISQLSISRGLAQLTRGTAVTVNSVLPGPTRSEGVVDFLRSVAADPTAPADEIEAEFFAKWRATSLLQRMIEPEEIASMVAYLASPLSSATNGAALRVEGGLIPTAA